jgi:hypothetical protein
VGFQGHPEVVDLGVPNKPGAFWVAIWQVIFCSLRPDRSGTLSVVGVRWRDDRDVDGYPFALWRGDEQVHAARVRIPSLVDFPFCLNHDRAFTVTGHVGNVPDHVVVASCVPPGPATTLQVV